MAELSVKTIKGVKGRILFIGDVHGCSRELKKLLKIFKPKKNDLIIALGDLINKGPDSAGVLKAVGEYKIQCIQGNHEQRLLKEYLEEDNNPQKAYDLETIRALKKSAWKKIKKWPHAIELPEFNILCIHGGFLPNSKWRKTDPLIATTVQVINSDGSPGKRSKFPDSTPWADYWKGKQTVLYGHTPREEIIIHDKAIGLDTSCVYGGKLSGWIYPNNEFIQISAQENYAAKWT